MLTRWLGDGTDGEVFETNRATAVKACRNERVYYNERDAYLHLERMGCTDSIGEFHLPMLQGFDDDLLVVEMDLMHDTPYVIDFGKVRLFRDPEFSEEVLRSRDEEGAELFAENWPRALRLLRDFADLQLFYLDPKPGNIVFG